METKAFQIDTFKVMTICLLHLSLSDYLIKIDKLSLNDSHNFKGKIYNQEAKEARSQEPKTLLLFKETALLHDSQTNLNLIILT